MYEKDGLDEIDSFWKYGVIENIIKKFNSEGLNDLEKSTFIIRDQVMLYTYQLLRIFEKNTGVILKLEAKERLFTMEKPSIDIKDVTGVDFDDTKCKLWSNYKHHLTSGSAIIEAIQKSMEGQLVKTREYVDMLSTLGCVDIYRSKHPHTAGYTVLGKHNTLIKDKAKAARSDYIFGWEILSDQQNNVVKLMKLFCVSCRVIPTGESDDQQLSTHFAIKAMFAIR
eukprot:TRINITY_DN550_c1_g1_i3.p1 TRINITY_DN550_c1_g1~~TRINITY_DN550_c1_g1_i3.p1  ORF type:complete len:241 (-),score=47.49 TRINITY_DN550_c1_g1_i3:171-845(-)